VIEAVIFDLDGVLIDSEQTWNSAREQLVRERGGTWRQEATREMMGMSSPEWSRYMHDSLGVEMEPEEIAAEVVRRMEALYREHLPIIDGACEAVAALSAHWRLGLASSANRQLIELVLDLAGMREYFAAAVSAEEVDHGKPAPDVYLEAARRIGVRPRWCAATRSRRAPRRIERKRRAQRTRARTSGSPRTTESATKARRLSASSESSLARKSAARRSLARSSRAPRSLCLLS